MLTPDMSLNLTGWNGHFAVLTAMVPEHFAVPLMYGDHTGLTRKEVAELDWFKAAVRETFGLEVLDLVEVSDEPEMGCWGPEDHWTDRLVQMNFAVPAGTVPRGAASDEWNPDDCDSDDLVPDFETGDELEEFDAD